MNTLYWCGISIEKEGERKGEEKKEEEVQRKRKGERNKKGKLEKGKWYKEKKRGEKYQRGKRRYLKKKARRKMTGNLKTSRTSLNSRHNKCLLASGRTLIFIYYFSFILIHLVADETKKL